MKTPETLAVPCDLPELNPLPILVSQKGMTNSRVRRTWGLMMTYFLERRNIELITPTLQLTLKISHQLHSYTPTNKSDNLPILTLSAGMSWASFSAYPLTEINCPTRLQSLTTFLNKTNFLIRLYETQIPLQEIQHLIQYLDPYNILQIHLPTQIYAYWSDRAIKGFVNNQPIFFLSPQTQTTILTRNKTQSKLPYSTNPQPYPQN